MDKQDITDAISHAKEQAAASAAAVGDLDRRLRDHRLHAAEKEVGELRLRLRRIDKQLEMLAACDAKSQGVWHWLVGLPSPADPARRRELRVNREAIQNTLSAVESEQDELSDDYEILHRHYEAASAHFKEASQRYLNLLREHGVEGITPLTSTALPVQSSPTPGEQLERLRAIAARESGRIRERAWRIKKKLRIQSAECAYCGEPLGEKPHADHIHPIAKGGLSIESNMVMVCESCNISKGTLTLQAFIRTFGLDRDAIEQRLLSQGKDF